jgi:hypothetical protein
LPISVVLALLWPFCVPAHGQGLGDPGKLGYNGRYDNKSVADLDLMTPADLNHAARDVCLWVVLMKKQAVLGDAKEYIETIGREGVADLLARIRSNGVRVVLR